MVLRRDINVKLVAISINLQVIAKTKIEITLIFIVGVKRGTDKFWSRLRLDIYLVRTKFMLTNFECVLVSKVG